MSLAITHFVSNDLDRIRSGQPVVLLLHGYGANEQDLPDLMNFLPELPWAALRAPIALGYGAFAWHSITTPLNPSLDDVEPATAAIWDWVEQNIPDESQMIVLGFRREASWQRSYCEPALNVLRQQ